MALCIVKRKAVNDGMGEWFYLPHAFMLICNYHISYKMNFNYKSANEVSNAINPFVSEVFTDVLGNIIAHKSGVGKRIMLIAHLDVVRLMVTHIDENGFLFVKPSGNIDASILQARKVTIKHEGTDITGIIGKRPIHLLREEQNSKVTYDSLWVDIGANSLSEALQMVNKGDYAYFCSEYEEMPNDLITGSYLDNQIGLNVLLKLAELFHNVEVLFDVYYVASNHEEIGMRGASVVAHSINPDVCICIDVTHATDYPSMNVISDGDIKLCEGCVLAKGPNIFPSLFKSLEETAIKHNIKYQVEVSPYPTGTDANVIQLCGEGVKTAVVSIPCRYMHTPHEVCSKQDMESTIKVIGEFIYAESEQSQSSICSKL